MLLGVMADGVQLMTPIIEEFAKKVRFEYEFLSSQKTMGLHYHKSTSRCSSGGMHQ